MGALLMIVGLPVLFAVVSVIVVVRLAIVFVVAIFKISTALAYLVAPAVSRR